MTDERITDYGLTRECEALARDIFEEFQRDHGADFDPMALHSDMDDRAHEVADGHAWVIYNHSALQLCAECDTQAGEEYLDDVGFEWKAGETTIYTVATMIAYGEMLTRIRVALDELVHKFEGAEA